MLTNLALQKIEQLTTNASLQTDEKNGKYIIISHPNFEAAFSLFGAQLLHFKKSNETPLIWLSETALFDQTKAIRGGIPICWPWFGPANEKLGNNLPAHGFVRTSTWNIQSVTEFEDGSGVEIAFMLASSQETLKIWPYAFELILKATLTDKLQLQLISQNLSTEAFYYTGALHTYLTIDNPKTTHISHLSNEYCNKLNSGNIEMGNGSLNISQAIDSIYRKTEDSIVLVDDKHKLNITVSNTGNDTNVLWNPWIEGAKAFKDMPDDGYKTMFCIESTITDQPGVFIAPGDSHILSTTIQSE